MINYFKIITNEKIVGVATSEDFFRYQVKHHAILATTVDNAQFVGANNTYYHDNWLKDPGNDITYTNATITRIEQEEYSILSQTLETEAEIAVQEDPFVEEPIEEPILEQQPNLTLEYVRNAKINEMSNVCHQTIVNGVDVVLSDGESHHFSLQIEDQIKIQALAQKALNGAETLFWHEDNKLCQFYSATDILTLYAALEEIQTYQTTYFNSLKMYILSLDNIDDISVVTYGMEIPIEYQSEVLKYLTRSSDEQ